MSKDRQDRIENITRLMNRADDTLLSADVRREAKDQLDREVGRSVALMLDCDFLTEEAFTSRCENIESAINDLHQPWNYKRSITVLLSVCVACGTIHNLITKIIPEPKDPPVNASFYAPPISGKNRGLQKSTN